MRPLFEPRAAEAARADTADLELTDLSVGELLLIWALRMRLARGPSGPVPGFRLAFGLSGIEAALAGFEGFYGVILRHCRRDIGMHAPGCPHISPDEMTLTGMIAELQAGAPAHAEAMAARLVDAGVLGGLLDHARALAASLKAEKLFLPVRALACDTAGAALVH